MGRPKHRRQIPFQLDLQFALVRRQDDGVDEASKRLRGFRAGFWMLQGLSQCGDLLTVQVRHSRVQERRRFVCRREFGFQFLAPRGVCVQLVLDFTGRDALHDGLDALLAPDLNAIDLALGGRQACAMLHPEPVHLAPELVAELFEQVLAKQLLLQRAEDARFDFFAPDGQMVVAASLVACTEASEPIL